MIETVLAVSVITFIFLALIWLSGLLNHKIYLEHAALRAARARTIGLNDYMCLKAARLAVVPVAGERLWPKEKTFDLEMERGRFANYLQAHDEAIARGILEYENWERLSVGRDAHPVKTEMSFRIFDEDESFGGGLLTLEGRADLEPNCDLYLLTR